MKTVGSSIPREYRLLFNFFRLFVAANPVWLESRTPIGNVKGCRQKAIEQELSFFPFSMLLFIIDNVLK